MTVLQAAADDDLGADAIVWMPAHISSASVGQVSCGGPGAAASAAAGDRAGSKGDFSIGWTHRLCGRVPRLLTCERE